MEHSGKMLGKEQKKMPEKTGRTFVCLYIVFFLTTQAYIYGQSHSKISLGGENQVEDQQKSETMYADTNQPEITSDPQTLSPATARKMELVRKNLQEEASSRSNDQNSAKEAGSAKNWFWQIIQLLLGLGGVLALAIVSVRALKKIQSASWIKNSGGHFGPGLQILETYHLGKDQKILWIKAGSCEGLVGVTSSSLTWLQTLSHQENKQESIQTHTTQDVQPTIHPEPFIQSSNLRSSPLRSELSVSLDQFLNKFKTPKKSTVESKYEA